MHTTDHDALTCRLNIHHRWRTCTTEDGSKYRRCSRCGKDDPGTLSGSLDGLAAALALW